MPIDLSAAGLPSPYPSSERRVLPWLVGWLLCAVMGAGLALLLWPANTPVQGSWFWFCATGLPNLVFLMALGISRTQYEAACAQAIFRNQHRQAWLNRRIHDAQRPLLILGAGYCLPFREPSLSEALAGVASYLRMQAPRQGGSLLMHGRFEDSDERFISWADDGDTTEEALSPADEVLSDERITLPVSSTGMDANVEVILGQALLPLVDSLHALAQQGMARAPAVRVMVATDDANAHRRVQQAMRALQRAGVPTLECLAAPDAESLLLLDAWLDAGEKRPLLIIGAEWHDTPLPGSTEGAAALLVVPNGYPLPDGVAPVATVHRPVCGPTVALGDVLANAVLWGNAEPSSVAQIWLSRQGDAGDTALLQALDQASVTTVRKREAQRHADGSIGHAGTASPWLAMAAAIEAGTAGPHLILDGMPIAQAAILYVNKAVPHDAPDE